MEIEQFHRQQGDMLGPGQFSSMLEILFTGNSMN